MEEKKRKYIGKAINTERKRFKIEVALLRHLHDCPFVPKLLEVDEKNLIFKTTYCGKTVENTTQNRLLISKLLKELEYRWGVYRVENIGRSVYELGTMRNATTDGNQIYIIDFGSSNWKRVIITTTTSKSSNCGKRQE
jgi:predicted Ser/Thr protein kinase